jgi:hypothetical protein
MAEEIDMVGLFNMFATEKPGEDPTMKRKDISIAFKVYFFITDSPYTLQIKVGFFIIIFENRHFQSPLRLIRKKYLTKWTQIAPEILTWVSGRLV